MAEADNQLQRDLECLRLASDFMQMSQATLNPDLHAHCSRMAKYWSEQADGAAITSTDILNNR